jgi:hypothetical protein
VKRDTRSGSVPAVKPAVRGSTRSATPRTSARESTRPARSRERSGRARRPLRLSAPLAMALCAASIGAVVMAGVRTAHDLKRRELRRMREQVNVLNSDIEGLQNDFEELAGYERIEREARRRGMVYPRAEQILSSGPVEATPAESPKAPQ